MIKLKLNRPCPRHIVKEFSSSPQDLVGWLMVDWSNCLLSQLFDLTAVLLTSSDLVHEIVLLLVDSFLFFLPISLQAVRRSSVSDVVNKCSTQLLRLPYRVRHKYNISNAFRLAFQSWAGSTFPIPVTAI